MYQKYGETKTELLIHYDNGWFTSCGVEATGGVILTEDKSRVTCNDCKINIMISNCKENQSNCKYRCNKHVITGEFRCMHPIINPNHKADIFCKGKGKGK